MDGSKGRPSCPKQQQQHGHSLFFQNIGVNSAHLLLLLPILSCPLLLPYKRHASEWSALSYALTTQSGRALETMPQRASRRRLMLSICWQVGEQETKRHAGRCLSAFICPVTPQALCMR